MRSEEYRLHLLDKIDSYNRIHRNFITLSRIFDIVGIVGLASVIIGYMMYNDVSIGLSMIPFDTAIKISFIGFVIGAVGACVGLSLKNEADEYQSKIDRINRMFIH